MFSTLKNLSLLASLASAAAIADFDLVERQTTSTSGTCATGLHLMIAGGCAVPCLEDVPSLLSTLIGNLTAAFPGTDQYYVPYNNVTYQGQVSTPWMIAAANQYFVDCPTTPVVFIGYSLGGIIVMNTLCGGLSVTNVPNVLAAITYGEETYRYPLSYDAGDCTASAPNYPRNGTQNCLPYASAIQNICAATDPNCCKTGTDYLSHYTYPQFYDYKMVDFVKARYAALQASLAATSTTASSTTSTPVSTVSTVSTTTIASASTTTVATTASTTATVSTTGTVSTTATGGVSTVSLTTTASTPASVSTTVTTISIGSATTIRSYSNSTFTTTTPSVPGYGTTTAGSGTSTSTSTKTVAIQITSTVPAAVSTFPAIPNSAILVPSSVQASYLPSVVTAVSGGVIYTGATAAATATATGSAGSGSGSSASATAAGSASKTTSGSAVATYTGAADKLSAAGGLVAAGLAVVAMAL